MSESANECTQHPLVVLSLGAGVQSSTEAYRSAMGRSVKYDCGIFADTGAEPRSVMEWLDKLERELPFPIYRVKNGNGLTESALRFRKSKKSGNWYVDTAIPMRAIGASGKAAPLSRQCTADFKIIPIQRKVRELLKQTGKAHCRMAIGISTDEVMRMKPSRVPYITNFWPLIDAGLSRTACIMWMRHNVGAEPPRSACTYCPFHSDAEWKRLRDNEPEAFASAVEFEREWHRRYDALPLDRRALKARAYLHQSCRPIDEVDFDKDDGQGQFVMECEGLCGN